MYLTILSCLLPTIAAGFFAPPFRPPAEAHPIHISHMKMRHDAESNTVAITYKVYMDDLQADIERLYGVDTKLMSGQPAPSADSLIQRYLADHVYFEINGKQPESYFLGFEIERRFQQVYAHEEARGVRKMRTVYVENAILMGLYDDQANHFTAMCESGLQACKLTHSQKGRTLEF